MKQRFLVLCFILNQRTNTTVDYFANHVRLVHVFAKRVSKHYLSIAWNINSNHKSLEREETIDFIEVRCLQKAKCMGIYPISSKLRYF